MSVKLRWLSCLVISICTSMLWELLLTDVASAQKEELANDAQAESASDASGVADIPAVLLTKDHRALCRLKVGDQLPPIKLPRIGDAAADLTSLMGKQATIVLFRRPPRSTARTALAVL